VSPEPLAARIGARTASGGVARITARIHQDFGDAP